MDKVGADETGTPGDENARWWHDNWQDNFSFHRSEFDSRTEEMSRVNVAHHNLSLHEYANCGFDTTGNSNKNRAQN
jgi:hypothetical protein